MGDNSSKVLETKLFTKCNNRELQGTSPALLLEKNHQDK